MRKMLIIIGLLVSILVAVPLLGACTGEEAPTGPIELSLAHMYPPGSILAQSIEEWAEKIGNESNGQLTIRMYPASTLIAANEMHSGIVAGAADMGSSFVYDATGFGMSASLNFLLSAPDIYTADLIYKDIWERFPNEMASEWENVKILWVCSTVPQRICFTKPVHNMEDFKGLQIRVPSTEMGDLVAAWGGTPVFLPMADLVIGLEKGTVDGHTIAFTPMYSFKMGGLTNWCLEFSEVSLGCATPLFVIMNKDSYNNLPTDLQRVIDGSLEWARERTVEVWGGGDALGREYFLDEGGELIHLSPEEEAKWLAIFNDQQAKYAQTLDAQGLPGTELFNFIYERIEYYAEQ